MTILCCSDSDLILPLQHLLLLCLLNHLLAVVANLIKTIPEALWLILDGILVDQNDLVLDPVIEGRIQADEATLHIGDPGEAGLEHVEEEDLV